MRLNFSIIGLAVLVFVSGSIFAALIVGRLVVFISADIATIVVAMAETIVAVVLLMTVAIEASSFFLIE